MTTQISMGLNPASLLASPAAAPILYQGVPGCISSMDASLASLVLDLVGVIILISDLKC